MKTTTTSLLALALVAAIPAQAQLFRPETVRGAVIGGVAGAVIGSDRGRALEGAAYGAAAGAIVGTAIGESRDHRNHRVTRAPAPVYRSYGYGHGRDRDRDRRPVVRVHPVHPRPVVYAPRVVYPAYRRPVVYAPPVYTVHRRPVVVYAPAVRVWRPDHVRTGMLLGGIAGAVIGHNNGRHGWEGAAYGMAAGGLIGVVAEHEAARHHHVAPPVVVSRPAAAPAPAPQQVTIINNYYGTAPAAPMAGANGLFGR